MPWIEDDRCNALLFSELKKLAEERGALERLVGAINTDEASLALDKARSGEKHQPVKALLVTTTLSRWLDGGLEKLKAAQPHKKRLVFEFLERSEAFRTAIYRKPDVLPEGLAAFFKKRRRLHGDLQFSGLDDLDGTYDSFQRSEEGEGKLDVSTLTIETISGVTCFSIQPHVDDSTADFEPSRAPIKGIMFNTSAAGMTMIAIGPFDLSIYSIADSITKRTGGAETRFIRGTVQVIGKSDSAEQHKFIAQSRGQYAPKYDGSRIKNLMSEIEDWLGFN